MGSLPGQLGSRATPYVARYLGNRFVGNSFREVATDVASGLADPLVTNGINQGIDHVNNTTGSRIPSYNSPPPNTLPSLFGSMVGGYLFGNRTYVMARATQAFHGPNNTNEGINNFVQDTHNAVHFDRFWENNGS